MRLIFFILLFAVSAVAQTSVTQYVDADCANNGDGTSASCAGTPGGVGAYNSLFNWESQNTDLVTADEVLTVEVDGADTATVLIDGWTTDSTRSITINFASTYSLSVDTAGTALLEISDNYITINGGGATLKNTRTLSATSASGLLIDGATNLNIKDLVIETDSSGHSSADGSGFYIREASASSDSSFANFLIKGNWYHGVRVRNVVQTGETYNIYNVTCVGADVSCFELTNYSSYNGTVNLKNFLATGYGTSAISNDGNATLNQTTNFSDADGTFAFVDAANNDYTLTASDTTGAYGGGTDLSADASFAVSTNINGETIAGWDAGAFSRSSSVHCSGSFCADTVSGLFVWLDSSETSSITQSSGAVSQIDDLSSAGNDFVQATGTNQPSTGLTTRNSLNVLDFDGSNDFLQLSSLTIPTSGTMILVVRITSVGGRYNSVFSAKGVKDFQLQASDPFSVALTSVFEFAYNGEAHSPIIYSDTDYVDSYGIFIYRYNFASSQANLIVDGVPSAGGVSDYTSAHDSPLLARIFTNRGGGGALGGNLAEYMYYDTALSDADLDTVGNYLGTKWDITWTNLVSGGSSADLILLDDY